MCTEVDYRHKCTVHWAERALDPLRGYEGITVVGGVGYAHGAVVCTGNFEKVDLKRKADYLSESLLGNHKLPIWC